MSQPRVLVVDDEPETVKYVTTNLRARGYQVRTAQDGREALKATEEELLNLIILDIGIPGLNGFEVCQEVRRWSEVPIIILSVRGRERDIIRALDLGADDYLTKPFSVEELLARVRAVLRRSAQTWTGLRPPFILNDLKIEFYQRRVSVGDRQVELTPAEYDLLAYLAMNAGRVLTHQALLQAVWGPEYERETEYLWAYIHRLRRKIEPDPSTPRYIFTEYGVGYRFQAP